MALNAAQLALFIFVLCASVEVTISFSPPSSDASSTRQPKQQRLKPQRHPDTEVVERRSFFQKTLGLTAITSSLLFPHQADAAPPMAVIAEELGYFPVTNKQGQTVYVPKRVSRASSEQAVRLAEHLNSVGATMYGAYWCPHCMRQKELLGREAFSLINYVECSPKGFGANIKLCSQKNVEGLPTWKFRKLPDISGEVPLSVLAQATQFTDFQEELEVDLPPSLGSNSCK